MRQIQLAGTDLKISRFGFGTASLHHVASASARRDLLAIAAEYGFTHFDTARMYGEGMAERTLGEFMRGRRSAFTVATKFGFATHRLYERAPIVMYAGRAVGLATRRLGLVSRPRERVLAPAAAEHSLSASLEALGTDWVDILFVHEPTVKELPAILGLADWLAKQKSVGRARRIGLAGAAGDCVAIARQVPGLFDILQVEDSIENKEADAVREAGWPLQITFGYVRRSRMRSGNAVHAPRPIETIAAAAARNVAGAILLSTRRKDHLSALRTVLDWDN
jgi:D-threo-aldose 1-dehydrogenase